MFITLEIVIITTYLVKVRSSLPWSRAGKSGYFWLRSNIIALTVFQFPATYHIFMIGVLCPYCLHNKAV